MHLSWIWSLAGLLHIHILAYFYFWWHLYALFWIFCSSINPWMLELWLVASCQQDHLECENCSNFEFFLHIPLLHWLSHGQYTFLFQKLYSFMMIYLIFFSLGLRYLLPEHVGPCTLRITYSGHTDLSVKFQSHRSRYSWFFGILDLQETNILCNFCCLFTIVPIFSCWFLFYLWSWVSVLYRNLTWHHLSVIDLFCFCGNHCFLFIIITILFLALETTQILTFLLLHQP